MRALILLAALLTLSPARADMPFNANFSKVDFSDSDLVPAWPESDRKREWPDGPIKDFLRDLQRPDTIAIPIATSTRAPAAMPGIRYRPDSRSSRATASTPTIAGMLGSTNDGC